MRAPFEIGSRVYSTEDSRQGTVTRSDGIGWPVVVCWDAYTPGVAGRRPGREALVFADDYVALDKTQTRALSRAAEHVLEEAGEFARSGLFPAAQGASLTERIINDREERGILDPVEAAAIRAILECDTCGALLPCPHYGVDTVLIDYVKSLPEER